MYKLKFLCLLLIFSVLPVAGYAAEIMEYRKCFSSKDAFTEELSGLIAKASKIKDEETRLAIRSYCFEAAGEYENALNDINKLIGMKGNKAVLLLARGRLKTKLGRNISAISDLKASLKTMPGHVGAKYYLAKAHFSLGQYEIAKNIIDSVVEKRGYHPVGEGVSHFFMMGIETALLHALILDHMTKPMVASQVLYDVVMRNKSADTCEMVAAYFKKTNRPLDKLIRMCRSSGIEIR